MASVFKSAFTKQQWTQTQAEKQREMLHLPLVTHKESTGGIVMMHKY